MQLEITNPSFKSLYMKGWLDRKGCNAIYCSQLNQEVAILHCETYLLDTKPCAWAPYEQNQTKDHVTHLNLANYIYECKIRHRDLLWDKLIKVIHYTEG